MDRWNKVLSIKSKKDRNLPNLNEMVMWCISSRDPRFYRPIIGALCQDLNCSDADKSGYYIMERDGSTERIGNHTYWTPLLDPPGTKKKFDDIIGEDKEAIEDFLWTIEFTCCNKNLYSDISASTYILECVKGIRKILESTNK